MNHNNQGSHTRDWATLPNAITLLRLILVVPVAILIINGLRPLVTVVLLIVFGASDWVDGYLARKLHQTSKTGAVLDPIADRIGVVVIALALVIGGHLSPWVALGVATVDVGVGVTFLMVRPVTAPGVSWVGKVRTAILMAGILLIGIGLIPELHQAGMIGQILCMIGAILHLIAGIGYVTSIMRGASKH